MLRQAICTSLRRVNRVAPNKSSQWVVSLRSRKYTVSESSPSPTETRGEVLENPENSTSALQTKPKMSNRGKPDAPKLRQPLPPPPEASTAPLLESEFSQYLKPLYQYGWGFQVIHIKGRRFGALRRDFHFASTAELLMFSEKTRNLLSGNIALSRDFSGCIVQLSSLDGVTRSMIRLAMEYQAEYEKIVGQDYSIPKVPSLYHVKSLEKAVKLLGQPDKSPAPPKTLTPLEFSFLPSPPPTPASSPPPSITESDLKTYIQPLVANGWSLVGVPVAALAGVPFLHRIYFFHDYLSARLFLDTVVAAIPAPVPDSAAGIYLRLREYDSSTAVKIWSAGELAEGAPKKYGISHADVRFAIAIENEFAANWAGRANNVALSTTQLLRTMQDVWNYRETELAKSRDAVDG
ncbi:hypothetical protein DFH09DRAFT_1377339 [Mycena vulgaris]|nr:hypothetical protein DFH09DRAFT_1377339 [Mycena vulgaris]